jgi:hypothetical protein
MKARVILTALGSVLVMVVGAFALHAQRPNVAYAASASTFPSGLSWQSGGYFDNTKASVALFATDRGRAVDLAETFTDPVNVTDMWWAEDQYGSKSVVDAGGKIVLSVPLWASNQTVNTDTRSMFTTLGTNIKNAGLAGKVIIRLGWEMNIDFGNWSVTSANRTQWVLNFRRAAAILRSPTGANAQIVFNPNEGSSQSGRLTDISTLANDLAGPYTLSGVTYPTAYDILGIDWYNWDASMNTVAGWTTRYNETYGMKFWEDRALALGKGFSVPEWGGTAAQNSASDNVVYVQQMVKEFARISGQLSFFEAYFNEPASWWAGTVTRYGSPAQAAQLPAAGLAYKNALAGIVTPTPTVTPSTTASPTPPPSPTC